MLVALLPGMAMSAGVLTFSDGRTLRYDNIAYTDKGVVVISSGASRSFGWEQVRPDSLPEDARRRHRDEVVAHIRRAATLEGSKDYLAALDAYSRLKGHLGYLLPSDREEPWGRDAERKAGGELPVDGTWMGREDIMAKAGYVKASGKWLSPEEHRALQAGQEKQKAEQRRSADMSMVVMIRMAGDVLSNSSGELSSPMQQLCTKMYAAYLTYKKNADPGARSGQENMAINAVGKQAESVARFMQSADRSNELAEEYHRKTMKTYSDAANARGNLSDWDNRFTTEATFEQYSQEAIQHWRSAGKEFTELRRVIGAHWELLNAMAARGVASLSAEKSAPPTAPESKGSASPLSSPDVRKTPPADSVEFNGHHYLVMSHKDSWEKAKERCEAAGGHLVIIESKEENDFLTQLARGQTVYIGMTDKDGKNGDYRWVDGTQPKYTNWGPSQPDNSRGMHESKQRYVILCGNDEVAGAGYNRRNVGMWDDQFNSNPKWFTASGYICEWDH